MLTSCRLLPYIKIIVLKYVSNNFKFKEYLVRNYLLIFFEIKLGRFQNENPLSNNYLDKFLSNVRWYISESYLEDIKILNGKVDLKEFWSTLKISWSSKKTWLPELTKNNRKTLCLRFILRNNKVECCLFYIGKRDIYLRGVYCLAISHKYIESTFFDKKINLSYNENIPLSKVDRGNLWNNNSINLRKMYNTIVTSFNNSPEKYEIRNKILVLKEP